MEMTPNKRSVRRDHRQPAHAVLGHEAHRIGVGLVVAHGDERPQQEVADGKRARVHVRGDDGDDDVAVGQDAHGNLALAVVVDDDDVADVMLAHQRRDLGDRGGARRADDVADAELTNAHGALLLGACRGCGATRRRSRMPLHHRGWAAGVVDFRQHRCPGADAIVMTRQRAACACPRCRSDEAPDRMIYSDRIDAAERLADALRAWRGAHPLVLAIPRGAVPMGRLIAQRLGGDLDVVLTRKLHAPGNPEYAIGAVDESGLDLRRRICGGRGRHARLHPRAGGRGAGDDEAAACRVHARARADRSGGPRGHRRRRRPRDRRHDDRGAARDPRPGARGNSSAPSRSPRPMRPRACAPGATTSSVRTSPPTSTPSGSSTVHFPQVSDDEVIALLQAPLAVDADPGASRA